MGNLYVVGLGPGDERFLTSEARAVLDGAEVICGYTTYIALIRDLYPEKTYEVSPMTQEIARCRRALELADGGKNVALVSGGDAGVYGMAGPVLELLPEFPGVTVSVIPGVTAALSGAAVLGAPLGHDFCVISLSDCLTSWDIIEKRLRCAAAGDFSVCLYNPASRSRPDHLRRACDILLETKDPDTVCGWVRNIGRDGQEYRILPLLELRDSHPDMVTTVFVGSGTTRSIAGRMVTPRGYRGTACGS